MNKKNLELLVCPECQAKLSYNKNQQNLSCDNCKLEYPVKDGIPVMLVEQATKTESSNTTT
jgi:uncharacterized protein YbaR (Trm112 family)